MNPDQAHSPYQRIWVTLAFLTLLAASEPATGQNKPAQPDDARYTLALETFAHHTGENAVDLTHAGDDTGRLFVSTQSGQVFAFDHKGASLGIFLDIPAARPDFTRTIGSFNGLMYIAFHPDYANHQAPGFGCFYTGHQVTPDPDLVDYDSRDFGAVGDSDVQFVVAQWRVDSTNPNRIDPASYRQVLRINFHTQLHNPHALGELAFNPYARPDDADYGNLYIAVGDSNGSNTSDTTDLAYVQRLDNPFGKILRINPLSDGEHAYTIPADNPFTRKGKAIASDTAPRVEAYAMGMRDPQSYSFAQDLEGKPILIVFDMGAGLVEEVNIVRPGGNYGWDRYEGTNTYDTTRELAGQGSRPPALQYGHAFRTRPGEDPKGGPAAIIGGFVVSDPDDRYFQNQLLFADLVRGSFFHANHFGVLKADAEGKQARCFVMNVEMNGKRGTFADVIDMPRADVRFGTGEDGTLYLVTKQTGQIFRTRLKFSGKPEPARPVMLGSPALPFSPWWLATGGVCVVGLITLAIARMGRRRNAP